jgi:hypothetical protein
MLVMKTARCSENIYNCYLFEVNQFYLTKQDICRHRIQLLTNTMTHRERDNSIITLINKQKNSNSLILFIT